MTRVKEVEWEKLIPPDQWAIYNCVISRLLREDIPFALGGGLAVSAYTGRLRNTKDLDIFIRPDSRDRVIQAMSDCDLTDYFDVKPYDRDWIYRGHRGEIIVDAIWSMANKRAQVDDAWLFRGPMVRIYETEVRTLPAEELIWAKLYVLQRDRCDWPDILNLVYTTGPTLDWDHLLDRVDSDLPLLKGVLSIFSWVSPEQARSIPHWVWESLGLPIATDAAHPENRPPRADLLDTRPWYSEQQTLQSAA